MCAVDRQTSSQCSQIRKRISAQDVHTITNLIRYLVYIKGIVLIAESHKAGIEKEMSRSKQKKNGEKYRKETKEERRIRLQQQEEAREVGVVLALE